MTSCLLSLHVDPHWLPDNPTNIYTPHHKSELIDITTYMKVFCFLLIHSSPASLPIVTHTHTTIHQICQEWLQTSGSGCNALSLREILTICEITCYQNLFSSSPASGWLGEENPVYTYCKDFIITICRPIGSTYKIGKENIALNYRQCEWTWWPHSYRKVEAYNASMISKLSLRH